MKLWYINESHWRLPLGHHFDVKDMKRWTRRKWKSYLKKNKLMRRMVITLIKESSKTAGMIPVLAKMAFSMTAPSYDIQISEKEKQFLQKQLVETAKTVGWGAIAAPPGTIPFMIPVIAALEVFGFKPLPETWYDVNRRRKAWGKEFKRDRKGLKPYQQREAEIQLTDFLEKLEL